MVNEPPNRGPSKSLGPFMPLIAIFAVVDFLLPMMVLGGEPEFLAAFLAGVLGGAICGQFCLLCLWAVFGAERLRTRSPGTLVVAISLYAVTLLGIAVADPPPDPDGALRAAVAGALILPLLFLGAQVPLWILRMATGWRIVVDGTQADRSPSQSRQFGLQQVLGATAAIAVALGLAGLGLPRLDGPDTTPDPSAWLGLMFGGPIYGAWALLWTVPCLWAAFIARDKAASAAVIAVYAAAMSFVILSVVHILSGGDSNLDGPGFLVVCLLPASLAAVLLGSLHLLRSGGYVLLRPLRPGRREPPATPRCASPLADTGDPSFPPSP